MWGHTAHLLQVVFKTFHNLKIVFNWYLISRCFPFPIHVSDPFKLILRTKGMLIIMEWGEVQAWGKNNALLFFTALGGWGQHIFMCLTHLLTVIINECSPIHWVFYFSKFTPGGGQNVLDHSWYPPPPRITSLSPHHNNRPFLKLPIFKS